VAVDREYDRLHVRRMMSVTKPTGTSGALHYIANGIDTVPGWFLRPDARLLLLAHEAQRACGVAGHLLEIGVFKGRSAVLLGYLFDSTTERLVVADLFDHVDAVAEGDNWRPEGTQRPQYDEFVTNYARFHGGLPEIIVGPSSDLDPETLGPATFRLIHVDGAHDWVNVDADIALVRQLASDDAILVFDDVGNPGYPAVGARVWAEVLAGQLHPIVATTKLYATTNPNSSVIEAFRSRILQAFDGKAVAHTIGSSEVLVMSPVDVDVDVDAHAPRKVDRSRAGASGWKRAAREVSPPLLYRGASRLSSLVRRPSS
jgi:hypothetical protein